MGPYCKFCDQRCFVPRWVPGHGSIILATCAKGMEHDREHTAGYDHTTAVNPSDPAVRAYIEATREAIYDRLADDRADLVRQAVELYVENRDVHGHDHDRALAELLQTADDASMPIEEDGDRG